MKKYDKYLYNVLIISKSNVDVAVEKLEKILKWRKEFEINGESSRCQLVLLEISILRCNWASEAKNSSEAEVSSRAVQFGIISQIVTKGLTKILRWKVQLSNKSEKIGLLELK